jgi:hypothetical protein
MPQRPRENRGRCGKSLYKVIFLIVGYATGKVKTVPALFINV